MQQLPKIARQRMRRALPVEHPDADVLTAFAERSLSDHERERVVEHLARCGDCREVMVLTLPEAPESAPDFVWRRPQHSWLSVPVLRWGTIAVAAVVIVTAASVLRVRENSSKKLMAYRPSQAVLVGTPNESSVPPAQGQGKAAGGLGARDGSIALSAPAPFLAGRAVPRRLEGAKPDAVSRSLDTLSSDSVSGGSNMQMMQPQSPARSEYKAWLAPGASPAPKTPVANGGGIGGGMAPSATSTPLMQQAQTQTVEVAAGAPPLEQEAQLSPAQAELQQRQGFEDQQIVGKAKEPPMAQAPVASAPGPHSASAASQVGAVSGPVSPQWTITGTGGLQRSYDQGKTWQDVHVNATPDRQLAIRQAEGSSNYSQQTLKENSRKLKRGGVVSFPVFRAVSAIGQEVWAAADGVLYYSSDGGEHWTASIPAANGSPLTGDITSVEFFDSSQGKVVTSTSEVWTTADGGQHWSRQ